MGGKRKVVRLFGVALALSIFSLASARAEDIAFENPAQGLRVAFREVEIRVADDAAGSWDLTFAPARISAGAPLAAAHPVLLEERAVEYRGLGGLTEEFTDSGAGLRHRIVLSNPAQDGEPFAVRIAIGGSVAAKLDEERNEVVFSKDGLAVARYLDLSATDAAGMPVPVRLDVEAGEIRISVLRAEAAWPVTIEGLVSRGKPVARRTEAPGSQAEALVAPANDQCPGAELIPAAGPFPHSTAVVNISDATILNDPVARPACAAGVEPAMNSVWYSFTPAQTGNYTFTSCADGGLTGTTVDDTVLAVYTSPGSCAGPFTQIAGGCDDDSCDVEDFQSFLATTLTQGVTYYVVVWSLGDPTVGNTNVQLLVTASFGSNPPANDTCNGAEDIPPAGPFPYLTAVTPDITDATTAGDPPTPSCSDSGTSTSRSVWYSFTPTTTGIYVLSTCSGDRGGTATTLADPILAIYTSSGGCGGTFTEIPSAGLSDGCDDDTCVVSALHATITTTLNSGTPYYILVSKVGSSVPFPGQAAIQLRVETVPAPTNDVCSGAVQLVLDRPVAGSTQQAGDDYRSPADAACYSGIGQIVSTAPGRDVVYSFTAPDTDKYSFRITEYSAALNPLVYVGSNCFATAPPATVTCLRGGNRTLSSRSEEAPCLSITQGTTVYAFVDEHQLSGGSPFVIEVNRCVDETEPNGTPVTAGPLACGVEGSIGAAGEVDFFSLASPAQNARLFAMAEGMAAGTSDFDLRATSIADTFEYDDLNLDTPYGALSPTLDGVVLPGGSAYLRVSLFNAGAIAEPYRLYSVIRPAIASAVAEVEPNGSAAQATASSVGYFSGALSGNSPSTDQDYFAVDANTGDLLLIGLDGDPLRDTTPLNAKLALFDPIGNLLVEVNDGDQVSNTTAGTGSLAMSTPRAPAEGIAWRARATGRYTVRIAAGSTSTTTAAGDYLLSIALNCSTPDDDGDGVLDAADCEPTNGGATAIPGTPGAPTFAADKQTITWTAASGGSANTYDVLRGNLSTLPVGPGLGDELCSNDQTVLTLQDPLYPTVGQGFWYVIRSSNSCGTGSYGFQGVRGTPGTERTSTTCQ